jgi:hypothetical protein
MVADATIIAVKFARVKKQHFRSIETDILSGLGMVKLEFALSIWFIRANNSCIII